MVAVVVDIEVVAAVVAAVTTLTAITRAAAVVSEALGTEVVIKEVTSHPVTASRPTIGGAAEDPEEVLMHQFVSAAVIYVSTVPSASYIRYNFPNVLKISILKIEAKCYKLTQLSHWLEVAINFGWFCFQDIGLVHQAEEEEEQEVKVADTVARVSPPTPSNDKLLMFSLQYLIPFLHTM